MSGEEGFAWGFFNALAEPGEVLRTAKLLGCQRILPKPIYLTDVYTAVREVIGLPMKARGAA